MIRQTVLSLIVSLTIVSTVQAQTATPTGTRTQTPTRTPTISSLPASCDELTVVSGNDTNAPAIVKFSLKASNPADTNTKYRLYFGDTQMVEARDTDVSHTYTNSGTYTVVAQVRDARGNWKSSPSCVKTVTIKTLPLVQNIEAHRSECSNIVILNRNQDQAPSTLQFIVTGFDNKGTISKTKLDYGDGTSEEKSSNIFDKQYLTPGTYIVKGYITDSKNVVKGGSQGCSFSLVVAPQIMTQQPNTGTPTWFSILAIGCGIASIVFLKIRPKLQRIG